MEVPEPWAGVLGSSCSSTARPLLRQPPVRAEAGETVAKPLGQGVTLQALSLLQTESRRSEDSAPSELETERWFWSSTLRRTSSLCPQEARGRPSSADPEKRTLAGSSGVPGRAGAGPRLVCAEGQPHAHTHAHLRRWV